LVETGNWSDDPDRFGGFLGHYGERRFELAIRDVGAFVLGDVPRSARVGDAVPSWDRVMPQI
jgi:hypothetical protein